ncbi:GAF and ANTAR domain-containing protein [Arthrobacter monumenti]
MSTTSTGTAEDSTLEHLQNMILGTDDVEKFLDELAHYTATKLSGADDEVLCGITLLRHKKAATVASSSERAQAMDELQYEYADGPCLNAAREHVTNYIPDLNSDERWREFTRNVAGRGMRSILAVPFQLEGGASAALNLYSDEAGKFDDLIDTAESFAVQASNALRLALRLAQHNDTEANLKAAMASRTTIDLAVGIIMGQSRCSQESAFDILRNASSHRNIKVREVAAEIVASVGQRKEPVTHFQQ